MRQDDQTIKLKKQVFLHLTMQSDFTRHGKLHDEKNRREDGAGETTALDGLVDLPWTCGAMWTSSKEKLLHITGHLREQVSVFGPQVCQVWAEYLLKAEYLAWARSNQRALAHSSSWIGCTVVHQYHKVLGYQVATHCCF